MRTVPVIRTACAICPAIDDSSIQNCYLKNMFYVVSYSLEYVR